MANKIAIENNLNNVKDYFKEKGFQVDSFDVSDKYTITNVDNYDAVIVSGANINFLGIQDTSTKIPVINVDGHSPEEIYTMIQE